jgi:NAD+ synthase
MRLSQDVFAIDCAVVVPRIEDFIRNAMRSLHRDGIVVPLSGGLDSSTVAALCARAVGRENVTGLMLPDIKGSPQAVRFGRLVVKELGIRGRVIDTTTILAAAGAYSFVANLVPRRLLSRFVRNTLARPGKNMFLEGIKGGDDPFMRRAFASIYARQRARVVVTFRYADLHGLLVAGSAHKSEDLMGLFVKFGIDDSADIMPLKNLFRSHVLQVARHVGVPSSVIGRTPNPEMLPGVEDKYLDVLRVPSETVDLVLFGLEHGMADADIAAQCGLTGEKTAEIRSIFELSAHMRAPSMSLDPLVAGTESRLPA